MGDSERRVNGRCAMAAPVTSAATTRLSGWLHKPMSAETPAPHSQLAPQPFTPGALLVAVSSPAVAAPIKRPMRQPRPAFPTRPNATPPRVSSPSGTATEAARRDCSDCPTAASGAAPRRREACRGQVSGSCRRRSSTLPLGALVLVGDEGRLTARSMPHHGKGTASRGRARSARPRRRARPSPL